MILSFIWSTGYLRDLYQRALCDKFGWNWGPVVPALAGVLLYSLDMDDHSGACGAGKFPMSMSVIHGLQAYMLYMQRKHMAIGEIYRTKINSARVSRRAYFMAGKHDMVAKVDQKIAGLQKEQDIAMGKMTADVQSAQAMMNKPFELPSPNKRSFTW